MRMRTSARRKRRSGQYAYERGGDAKQTFHSPAPVSPQRETKQDRGVSCAPATKTRPLPARPAAPQAKTSPKSRCSPPRDFSRRLGKRSSRKTPFPPYAAGSASIPAKGPATAASTTTRSPSTPWNVFSPTRPPVTISGLRLPASPREERIAVVGAGPAGLAAAWFLTLLGYSCDVFEASPEAGAFCAGGSPHTAFRPTCSARICGVSRREGIRIFTHRPVDRQFFAEAAGRYQAVILACGHGRGRASRSPVRWKSVWSKGLIS